MPGYRTFKARLFPAGFGASIRCRSIAVITGFACVQNAISTNAFFQIELACEPNHRATIARLNMAQFRAPIAVFLVAVVTVFAIIKHVIATGFGCECDTARCITGPAWFNCANARASVAHFGIAIVTFFTRFDDVIAALTLNGYGAPRRWIITSGKTQNGNT